MVPLADPLITVLTRDILELAARYRLPTMMEDRERVEAGTLLSYSQDPRDAYRRAASYVDRILKGATPGDLFKEQFIELVAPGEKTSPGTPGAQIDAQKGEKS